MKIAGHFWVCTCNHEGLQPKSTSTILVDLYPPSTSGVAWAFFWVFSEMAACALLGVCIPICNEEGLKPKSTVCEVTALSLLARSIYTHLQMGIYVLPGSLFLSFSLRLLGTDWWVYMRNHGGLQPKSTRFYQNLHFFSGLCRPIL